MAVTNTARLGLHQWSAGTDPFTRAQMNAAFLALEGEVVGFVAPSTAATRPAAAAANAHMIHRATDTGAISYSTGSAWVELARAGVALNMADAEILRAHLRDYSEAYEDLSNTVGARVMNMETAAVFRAAPVGAITLSITNPPANLRVGSVTLMLHGNPTVTWPANTSWPNNTPPVLTSGRWSMITFLTFDAGANWFGTYVTPMGA